MKKVSKLVKRINSYKFNIPTKGRVEFKKKRLDNIRPGDHLFTSSHKKIVQSYYLPTELGIQIKDCKDYLVRLNGEYVVAGEPLAERLVNGGLTLKRVFSNEDGILSFDRLQAGYLDILSETVYEDFVSPIYGKVIDVDVNNGVTVETSALCVNGLNNFSNDKAEIISGVFKFIGEGKSVYVSKDLEKDYDGCIVFAGRYVYPKFIEEIYARGALHVIVYSMDYLDFKNLGSKVTVLGGFGHITFPEMWYQALSDLNGSYMSLVLKKEKSEISIADTGQYAKDLINKTSDTILPQIKRGMNVRIRDVDYLNIIGKVEDVNAENDYVLVDIGNEEKIILSPASLDIISY